MSNSYTNLTQHFETIADFLRFGLTESNKNELFYGHGTDNPWDDILTLVLRSLSLPLDLDKALLTTRLTSSEKLLLASRLEKRIKHKIPVPYLTNEAFF